LLRSVSRQPAPSGSCTRKHRHGLASPKSGRTQCPDSPTFRPLHSATPRRFAAFQRIGNCRDRPEIVSAASFRSVSAPKSLPLGETVRPHSADESCLTLCSQTPRRTACAPAPLAQQTLRCVPPPKSQGKWLRADATRPTNPLQRQINFGFADGWHEGCEPGSRTRAIIFKAAPMQYPAGA